MAYPNMSLRKKSTAKCPKSVHILLKMVKSLIIKYNLSNILKDYIYNIIYQNI